MIHIVSIHLGIFLKLIHDSQFTILSFFGRTWDILMFTDKLLNTIGFVIKGDYVPSA